MRIRPCLITKQGEKEGCGRWATNRAKGEYRAMGDYWAIPAALLANLKSNARTPVSQK